MALGADSSHRQAFAVPDPDTGIRARARARGRNDERPRTFRAFRTVAAHGPSSASDLPPSLPPPLPSLPEAPSLSFFLCPSVPPFPPSPLPPSLPPSLLSPFLSRPSLAPSLPRSPLPFLPPSVPLSLSWLRTSRPKGGLPSERAATAKFRGNSLASFGAAERWPVPLLAAQSRSPTPPPPLPSSSDSEGPLCGRPAPGNCRASPPAAG